MQFKVEGAALRDAVNRITHATETKKLCDKDKFVRIISMGTEIRVAAYGYHMEALAVLPTDTRRPAEQLAVPVDLFADLVKELPEGEVSFHQKSDRLEIRAGASTFKLNTFPDMSVFPDRLQPEREFGPFNLPAFLEALARVSYCVSEEGRLPYFKCVYVDGEGFAGTDGGRIALAPNKAFACPSMMLLPAATLSRVQKLFRDLPPDAPAGIGSDGKSLFLMGGGVYARLNLLDADAIKYPNFRGVIPSGPSKTATIPRKALLDALRRVMVISDDSITHVTLGFSELTLALTCKNEDGTSAQETVCFQGDGGGHCTMNGDFLKEALQNLTKDDVVFELRDRGAIILTDGEFRHVVQPIAKGN